MQAFSLPCRERYFRISQSGDAVNEIFRPAVTSDPDCGILVFQTCR